MKAFLLAAGHGTRLRPLTDKTPKCLLPIRGVPLLQIWLQTCAFFGIDEVLINVHAHAPAVREFLEHYRAHTNVRVVEESELLGSAGTIINNRDWIGSSDCFWVFYADVLCRVDLTSMLQLHRSKTPIATIGAYRVADPTRCGVLEVNSDGTVVDFVEKPLRPKSNLAFSGILLGSQSLLDVVPSKQPVDFGFDVFPILTGKMLVYPITTYLLDIGTMQNYELAQHSWPGLDS